MEALPFSQQLYHFQNRKSLLNVHMWLTKLRPGFSWYKHCTTQGYLVRKHTLHYHIISSSGQLKLEILHEQAVYRRQPLVYHESNSCYCWYWWNGVLSCKTSTKIKTLKNSNFKDFQGLSAKFKNLQDLEKKTPNFEPLWDACTQNDGFDSLTFKSWTK